MTERQSSQRDDVAGQALRDHCEVVVRVAHAAPSALLRPGQDHFLLEPPRIEHRESLQPGGIRVTSR